MALTVMLYGNVSYAQTMTEIQPLSFGQIATRDNDASHTITVAPNGSTSYSASLVPGVPQAQRGEYQLAGFPPNMTLTFGTTAVTLPTDGGIIVDNPSALTTGGPRVFTIDTFTGNSPTTDGAGNATFYLGGTMHTSGDMTTYPDGGYTGSVDITFYFQ